MSYKDPRQWTPTELALACAITWALGFALSLGIIAWRMS